MGTKEYDKFILEIDSHDAIKARVYKYGSGEDSTPDARADNARLDDDKYLRQDIREGIQELKKGTLDGRQNEIRRLGRNLYRAIFPGEVGSLFEGALKSITGERKLGKTKRWLRVIIDISPESSVFDWPLEFLYCSELDRWLGTDKTLIALSRRTVVQGQFERGPVHQEPPLHVLVVISMPEGLEGVITATVLEKIGELTETDASGDVQSKSKRMDVRVIGQSQDYVRDMIMRQGFEYLDQPATYGILRGLITGEAWQPHVLHFIGHGKFEDEKGHLALVKDGGSEDWCSGDDISQLFTPPAPSLVVLQACESAQHGTEPGLMSLADHLVKREIPAVVAMQWPITNQYASVFATGFYEALREGRAVDEAVQAGRWKISNEVRWNKHYFGIPVLFAYDPGRIIQPTHQESRKPGTGPVSMVGGGRAVGMVEQARNMIEKALYWLEDEDHHDEEHAILCIKSAYRILENDRPLEARKIVDARECLVDLQDVESARRMLEHVSRCLGMPEVKGRPPMGASQPVRDKEQKHLKTGQAQWRQHPGGISPGVSSSRNPRP
ncbi:MAG: CHAT domain-containing protein [Desulfobacteraceae bacterium]